uniref:WD repeat-containing protein 60 n=1 Tax=Glossina morsitans morsitans TaxID=37546 RepID=A0A1B0GBI9_GLOMM
MSQTRKTPANTTAHNLRVKVDSRTKDSTSHSTKVPKRTETQLLSTSGEDKKKINVVNTLPKPQDVKIKAANTKLRASTDRSEKLETQLNTSKISTSKKPRINAKDSKVSNVIVTKPSATISSTKKRVLPKQAPILKPNAVLDTYHNVTVASPPPRKKGLPLSSSTDADKQNDKDSLSKKLNRKNSHTLSPGEIVVLKEESAKKRLEEQINRETNSEEKMAMPIKKESIAFEVNFHKEQKATRARSRSRSKTRERIKKLEDETEDSNNYSDDFESYESDFETPTSSETESDGTEVSSTDSNSHKPPEKEIQKNKTSSAEASEEESEVTQNPITVIQRYKERKLDSGNYDINDYAKKAIPRPPTNVSNHFCDSLDTISLATSDQLDSGVSAYSLNHPNDVKDNSERTKEVSYGGYSQFYSKPIFNECGKEVMSKIQFDALSFVLLDMKPISYEMYMQSFGKLHTAQISTQTQNNLLDVEVQTDELYFRSIWTQHPALYNSRIMEKLRGQQCCGEFPDIEHAKPENSCKLENSLKTLRDISQKTTTSKYHQNLVKQKSQKPLDLENLNSFLLKSSLVISQILKTKRKSLRGTNSLSISEGFYCLESNFLNTLAINRVYSNVRYNLVITVHESLPGIDVYHSNFINLLTVWCVDEPKAPIRLLSTWSKVSHVEISEATQDIIVTALQDGSIAMWDLRETYSYCSKLDGYLKHFAATQSIVPAWYEKRTKSKKIAIDVGSCITIKSFRCPNYSSSLKHTLNNFQNSQFVSLHDSGILTIWTLVETSSDLTYLSNRKLTGRSSHVKKSTDSHEYNSPWARVKLIQSAIIQLKDYLECKNARLPFNSFKQTQNLFEQNIYSDKALREIGAQKGLKKLLQNVTFQSLDVGSETIYICTNHNYILCCPKSLKPESFRRITLNESDALFLTALKVLTNEHFVAVGLSNGAVLILNCNHNKNPSICKDKSSENEKFQEPTKKLLSEHSFDDASAISKSCAIQNIILNERRSIDRDFCQNSEQHDTQRPSSAACVALINSKQKSYELIDQDQLTILTGSVLRKSLVKSLQLSFDGWRLFVLSDNNLRVYDFYSDQEVAVNENNESLVTNQIKDITTTKSDSERQHLIILRKNGATEIHQLKK